MLRQLCSTHVGEATRQTYYKSEIRLHHQAMGQVIYNELTLVLMLRLPGYVTTHLELFSESLNQPVYKWISRLLLSTRGRELCWLVTMARIDSNFPGGYTQYERGSFPHLRKAASTPPGPPSL